MPRAGGLPADRRGGLHVTRRQREVLALLATGLTDKEVARRLSISISTVRTHLERFYEANGVRNQAQAVAAWLRHSGNGGARLERVRRRNVASIKRPTKPPSNDDC